MENQEEQLRILTRGICGAVQNKVEGDESVIAVYKDEYKKSVSKLRVALKEYTELEEEAKEAERKKTEQEMTEWRYELWMRSKRLLDDMERLIEKKAETGDVSEYGARLERELNSLERDILEYIEEENKGR